MNTEIAFSPFILQYTCCSGRPKLAAPVTVKAAQTVHPSQRHPLVLRPRLNIVAFLLSKRQMLPIVGGRVEKASVAKPTLAMSCLPGPGFVGTSSVVFEAC